MLFVAFLLSPILLIIGIILLVVAFIIVLLALLSPLIILTTIYKFLFKKDLKLFGFDISFFNCNNEKTLYNDNELICHKKNGKVIVDKRFNKKN